MFIWLCSNWTKTIVSREFFGNYTPFNDVSARADVPRSVPRVHNPANLRRSTTSWLKKYNNNSATDNTGYPVVGLYAIIRFIVNDLWPAWSGLAWILINQRIVTNRNVVYLPPSSFQPGMLVDISMMISRASECSVNVHACAVNEEGMAG